MDNGDLWCHNQVELEGQNAQVMELLKKQGKNLKDGRGAIVQVDLQQGKGLIERVCELWSSGWGALRQAAIEEDNTEKIKQVTAFVVSGLHNAVASGGQRVPIYPVIGETYAGIWPSGNDGIPTIHVYGEQITEDLTRILVESSDGLFTIEAAIEYQIQMLDSGNTLNLTMARPFIVNLPSGKLTINYPTLQV